MAMTTANLVNDDGVMIWTRTATASDAGSTLRVNLVKLSKISLILTAYRGVGVVRSRADDLRDQAGPAGRGSVIERHNVDIG